MSMKEIEVKITGYKRAINKVRPYQYTEFTLQPVEIVPEFDFSKTYKLVEDEPVEQTNCITGGCHLPYIDVKDLYPSTMLFARKNGKTDIIRRLLNKIYGLPPIHKARVMFNGNATILEIGDFKTVVKCHEGDEFNELIGLGLALSRYYTKQKSTKNEMK